ncbi:hypothetical protein, partial [Xanthomonas euvesicatoria]|uniref:hypothetical protein n=1 Tax=Xanthomonas euvesicatoria TaxID=456327 RepID=UPI0019D407C4
VSFDAISLDPDQNPLIETRVGSSHAPRQGPTYAASSVANRGDSRVRDTQSNGCFCRPPVALYVLVPVSARIHAETTL